ncbi:MAG: hypothetical protein R2867_38580 [Caldilineaceae bacterium]
MPTFWARFAFNFVTAATIGPHRNELVTIVLDRVVAMLRAGPGRRGNRVLRIAV